MIAACALVACAQSTPAPPGGDAATSPPDEGDDCILELGTGEGAVSFEQDLMPFFSVTCAFGGCHDGLSRLAGLYLGPNFTDPVADEATRREVHASLLAPASTTRDLPRVTPFEPARSFLVLKINGCQNHANLSCNGTAANAPCGARMPALSDPLPAASRSLIARWIAAGAPEN